LLNHSIRENQYKYDTYRHDCECNKLSREETLRTLEDKLRNLHEDRIAKERD
jgi:hypothetical protein